MENDGKVGSINWTRCFFGLLLLALVIGVISYHDYGISWDYEAHDTYGQQVLRWYLSLGQDREAVTQPMKYYGAGFELFVGLIRAVVPGDYYDLRAFATFVFALLGVVGVFLLGRKIGGSLVGFLSCLFLLATPMYYGHAFINHKDLPLAVTYTWAILAIICTLDDWPSLRWSRACWAGLAVGAALSIRVGALFIFAVVGFAWLFRAAQLLFKREGSHLVLDVGGALLLLGKAVTIALVAWIVMALLWPYALVSPIQGPIDTIRKAAQYPWRFPVLFAGRIFIPPATPLSYIPVWFLIALPEFIFLGWLAGAVCFWRVCRRSTKDLLVDAHFCQAATVLFAIVFPVVLVLVKGSTVYDAVRHFLFVVPSMAVLSAAGMSAWLAVVRPATRSVAISILVVSLLVTVGDMAALHPYQYVYFNRFIAGGLQREADRYETEYWATCCKESVEWLAQRFPQQPAPKRVKISGWADALQIEQYVKRLATSRPDFAYTPLENESDIYITTARFGGNLFKPYKLLHTVDRQGVPLCYIFAR